MAAKLAPQSGRNIFMQRGRSEGGGGAADYPSETKNGSWWSAKAADDSPGRGVAGGEEATLGRRAATLPPRGGTRQAPSQARLGAWGLQETPAGRGHRGE